MSGLEVGGFGRCGAADSQCQPVDIADFHRVSRIQLVNAPRAPTFTMDEDVAPSAGPVDHLACLADHLLGGAGFSNEAALGSTLALRAMGMSGGQIFDPTGEPGIGRIPKVHHQRLAARGDVFTGLRVALGLLHLPHQHQAVVVFEDLIHLPDVDGLAGDLVLQVAAGAAQRRAQLGDGAVAVR